MPKEKINIKEKPIIPIIVIGLTVFIVALIIILGKGKTTITGEYPTNVSDDSLVCSADGLKYPFFTYDESNKKTTEIRILFSRDAIKSISLTHTLFYDDMTNVIGSEAHNHAALGKSFANDGLGVDEFNAVYTKFDDRMQMNLYATNAQLNDVSMKYFMLNTKEFLIGIDDFQRAYQNYGFRCEIK